MKLLIDHHHYKAGTIPASDRVAVYERHIIDLLTIDPLPDEKRESSIAFELKHHHSTAQFARILARKRNLLEDICVVGALLHDVSVIVRGTYKNHAHESATVAQSILDKIGLFSQDEKEMILKIVYYHSDKEIFSDDKYEEFGKDVDILDSFLYPNAFGYYLKHKKMSVFKCYIQRAIAIWHEVGLEIPCDFSVLDNYAENWLDAKIGYEFDVAENMLALLLQLIMGYNTEKPPVPTFAIHRQGHSDVFYFNSRSYNNFSANISQRMPMAFNLQTPAKYKDMPFVKEQTFIAREILLQARKSFVIIWSSIDSYELLDVHANSERISELGIKL
jgi:hypothetical protein